MNWCDTLTNRIKTEKYRHYLLESETINKSMIIKEAKEKKVGLLRKKPFLCNFFSYEGNSLKLCYGASGSGPKFSCSCPKSQNSRDKCWAKGKFALFRKLATWEDGGLAAQGHLPSTSERERFKC